MSRTKAAAGARAVLADKRARLGPDYMHREIVELRQQVGYALSRTFTSGLNVNLGDIDEDYVPELRTLHGRVAIYERMINDPLVAGQLSMIEMALTSGVRWKVEGGKQEHQDFIRANFLRDGPKKFWCDTSWMEFLSGALSCLAYGFSMFGKVRRVVDDKIIFGDLQWLHPRSVDEDGWVMDDADRLIEVRRTYHTGGMKQVTREPVPVSELFILPWDKRGPNWEGRALIRRFYRPWKERDLVGKIWLIDLQNRGIGIPMAQLSGVGGKAERDTLVEILKSLRGGSKERAFIVIDKDSTVKFLTSEGQVANSKELLDTKRSEMSASNVAQALDQGNTETGSRAASSTLMTPYLVHVDGIREKIQDIINHGAGPMMGLVEEAVYMNFGDVEECPRIVGSRFSPTEQLDNIPHVNDAIQKGGMVPHLKYNNEMARRLGWPELTEEEYEKAQAAQKTSPFGGGAGRPGEIGPQDNPEDPRDDTNGRRFGLQDKRRPLGERLPKRKVESWPWLS